MTALKTSLLYLLLFCGLPAEAQRYSVLIHEIMADPQPPIGLPEAEYIELRNVSPSPINLSGWRLQTGTATSGAFPAYILPVDSLIIITSRTNAPSFTTPTLGIASFPALANSGTTLTLLNAAGTVIHAVAYGTNLYGNAVKAAGGWSLEMMDATNPCGGAGNWKAALHPSGGTPGRYNSVQGPNRDESPPALLAAIATDSLHLLLQFDEGLDSASAGMISSYQLEPKLSITQAVSQPPLYQQVLLTMQTPLQQGTVYTVAASGIADCAGNSLGRRHKVLAGLPQMAVAGDVVINELLFNPKMDGADYVELFNRSPKVIDLSRLWVTDGAFTATAVSQPQRLATDPVYLFPGHYAVVTEKREGVLRQYLVKNESALLEVASLPSLPDDKGRIKLVNGQGQVVDDVTYDHNWHFGLLSKKEGVALERIDPDAASNNRDSWTSAAATAGYGTPTYQNSQYRQQAGIAATWGIAPQVFSPDGDGFDDFCTISFQLDQPNSVANLFVFDAGGRPVRHLVQNVTVAQSGFWRWDGLNDTNRSLPTGTYILLLELFNLQGKKQQWKKAVVLARKR